MKIAKRIGFTTSLPVEVIFAAGHIPIDLNNCFITQNPAQNIVLAEQSGFPRNICAWIKGNYIAALNSGLDMVLGVIQGDCSNTHSILNLMQETGMPVYHFSFPPQRDYALLDSEICRLEQHFEVDRIASTKVKHRLDKIRQKLIYLDELTWKHRLVSGAENHYWLVNSSDFWGNPDFYEEELDSFIRLVQNRDPLPTRMRLGYIGVPPIFKDLYDVIGKLGGDVVFNEVQRQFAMPDMADDLVEQYLRFTYPYSVFERLADIQQELQQREIDGIIGYNQSFCHLQIDNILLKKHIDLPFLTLEGDQPDEIDPRTLLRLESFFEVHSS